METKINIAAILKDKPKGTKLYSSACGKCELKEAEDKSFKVSFYSSKFGFMNDGEGIFDKNGKLYDDGECVVFPSKEMRNWSKFAWKKGDVLVGVGQRIIFEKFIDENYTRFQGKYSLSTCEDKTLVADKRCYTSDFRKLDDSGNVKNYFKELEEKLGGKLNRETLEVEKPQPEFKNGDIVVYGESVAICRRIYKHTLSFYVSLNEMFGLLFADEVESSEEYRFATEEEKHQLFDALEKEGKAWDAEKKQIVDLKPKCEFKPFDKVLSRRCSEDYWVLNFYSHKTDYYHICIDGSSNLYCIPYNEETAHLLGTTDEWKEGEQ